METGNGGGNGGGGNMNIARVNSIDQSANFTAQSNGDNDTTKTPSPSSSSSTPSSRYHNPHSSHYRRRLYTMRGRTLSEGIDIIDDHKQQSKKALRSILKTNTFSAKASKQCSFDQTDESVCGGENYGESSDFSGRRHKSMSMLYPKNSLEREHNHPAGNIATNEEEINTSSSNVHFAPSTGYTKVLLYDPNQSAHESVISGKLPVQSPTCSLSCSQDSPGPISDYSLGLDNDNDSDLHEQCDLESDRLLAENSDLPLSSTSSPNSPLSSASSGVEKCQLISRSYHESPSHYHRPNSQLKSSPSPITTSQTLPLMRQTCELSMETSRYSTCSDLTSGQQVDSDDPWYCERCGTWFGSPDPSYPEHCRCVDSSLKRDSSGPPNLSKSDTLNSNDTASIYSQSMHKDFRYYFQHPFLRLFIALSVIFCNFLIYGEDPISHSQIECSIPVVGNVLAFIFTKNPPEFGFRVLKLTLNFVALILGSVLGKYFIHRRLLVRWARIKMFRDDSGTWMVMGAGIVGAEYFISHVYNLTLLAFHSNSGPWLINSLVGVNFAFFMKCAACGTWLGDFSTAWMIIDMMLQDNLYPCWALRARRFWRQWKTLRIIIFWVGGFLIAGTVIFIIQMEFICWDCLDFLPLKTNELSRSFLASFILLQDLVIVMQDWDFPHFVTDLNIKLPGLLRPSYRFWLFAGCQSRKSKASCEIKISGKWFNYGIIVMVMMFDLNMWKNQIIYSPEEFGQYVSPINNRIYVVTKPDFGKPETMTWSFRSGNVNPETGKLFIEEDLLLKAQYRKYPSWIKALSFIPIAIGFTSFFSLIYLYGRFPPKTDKSAGGRRIKRSSSNWQRERNQSRRLPGLTSGHYWSNILLRNRARNFMARVSDRASQFGPNLLRFSAGIGSPVPCQAPPASPSFQDQDCHQVQMESNNSSGSTSDTNLDSSDSSFFSIWSFIKPNKH